MCNAAEQKEKRERKKKESVCVQHFTVTMQPIPVVFNTSCARSLFTHHNLLRSTICECSFASARFEIEKSRSLPAARFRAKVTDHRPFFVVDRGYQDSDFMWKRGYSRTVSSSCKRRKLNFFPHASVYFAKTSSQGCTLDNNAETGRIPICFLLFSFSASTSISLFASLLLITRRSVGRESEIDEETGLTCDKAFAVDMLLFGIGISRCKEREMNLTTYRLVIIMCYVLGAETAQLR